MPDFAGSLTPGQVARLAALYADPQVSMNEIGAAFGISVLTVYRAARALGLPPNPERRRVQGRRGQAKRNVVVAVLNGLGREPSADYCLPPVELRAQPARPRPGDRPGERWVQLI